MPDHDTAISPFAPASRPRIRLAKAGRRSRQGRRAVFKASKRSADILGASTGLLLLSPVLLLVMAAIRFESPGPATVPHIRTGMNGRRFRLYKFRTNYWATTGKHGPRMTRVGRIISKLSIDRLPQLWNVLNGTMSLVGPRPDPQSGSASHPLHHPGCLTVRPGMIRLHWLAPRYDHEHRRPFKTDLGLMLKAAPAVTGSRARL